MTGVYGYAYKSYMTPSMFAAGVAGVTHYYGGIGVYGSCSGSIPSTMEANAKYAVGGVYIIYNILYVFTQKL